MQLQLIVESTSGISDMEEMRRIRTTADRILEFAAEQADDLTIVASKALAQHYGWGEAERGASHEVGESQQAVGGASHEVGEGQQAEEHEVERSQNQGEDDDAEVSSGSGEVSSGIGIIRCPTSPSD